MAIAIEDRSLKNVPQVYREALEKAGLKESYLNDNVFVGLHREMARQVRTAQGTVQEAANQRKDQMLRAMQLIHLQMVATLHLSKVI